MTTWTSASIRKPKDGWKSFVGQTIFSNATPKVQLVEDSVQFSPFYLAENVNQSFFEKSVSPIKGLSSFAVDAVWAYSMTSVAGVYNFKVGASVTVPVIFPWYGGNRISFIARIQLNNTDSSWPGLDLAKAVFDADFSPCFSGRPVTAISSVTATSATYCVVMVGISKTLSELRKLFDFTFTWTVDPSLMPAGPLKFTSPFNMSYVYEDVSIRTVPAEYDDQFIDDSLSEPDLSGLSDLFGEFESTDFELI